MRFAMIALLAGCATTSASTPPRSDDKGPTSPRVSQLSTTQWIQRAKAIAAGDKPLPHIGDQRFALLFDQDCFPNLALANLEDPKISDFLLFTRYAQQLLRRYRAEDLDEERLIALDYMVRTISSVNRFMQTQLEQQALSEPRRAAALRELWRLHMQTGLYTAEIFHVANSLNNNRARKQLINMTTRNYFAKFHRPAVQLLIATIDEQIRPQAALATPFAQLKRRLQSVYNGMPATRHDAYRYKGALPLQRNGLTRVFPEGGFKAFVPADAYATTETTSKGKTHKFYWHRDHTLWQLGCSDRYTMDELLDAHKKLGFTTFRGPSSGTWLKKQVGGMEAWVRLVMINTRQCMASAEAKLGLLKQQDVTAILSRLAPK